jgi:hypothetical protein
MRGKLRILAWALLLLALAYPPVISPVLDMLGIAFGMALAATAGVIAWAVTNLSLTLTIAAALLLARAFPSIPRWVGRSWVASVAAVAPAKV